MMVAVTRESAALSQTPSITRAARGARVGPIRSRHRPGAAGVSGVAVTGPWSEHRSPGDAQVVHLLAAAEIGVALEGDIGVGGAGLDREADHRPAAVVRIGRQAEGGVGDVGEGTVGGADGPGEDL